MRVLFFANVRASCVASTTVLVLRSRDLETNATDAPAPLSTRAGNTCLLVAYHNDKVQPGQCRSTVGKLADFLKESGI